MSRNTHWHVTLWLVVLIMQFNDWLPRLCMCRLCTDWTLCEGMKPGARDLHVIGMWSMHDPCIDFGGKVWGDLWGTESCPLAQRKPNTVTVSLLSSEFAIVYSQPVTLSLPNLLTVPAISNLKTFPHGKKGLFYKSPKVYYKNTVNWGGQKT